MELEVHWAGSRERSVGRLYQNESGRVFFEYDPAWRAENVELSPVYLPNSTQGAVSTPTPGFGELHGLFQDALPDWWGERLMQRHFESRGIPWNRVTALRKLACQGNRKMGALAFLPAMDEADFNDAMVTELGALVDAARETLRGATGDVLAALFKTGMSPGGAQPKALLAISDDFSEVRLDDPPQPGFGAWLIKFDIEPVLHEGRIEAAYADMARAAGITVPETRSLEDENRRRLLRWSRYLRPAPLAQGKIQRRNHRLLRRCRPGRRTRRPRSQGPLHRRLEVLHRRPARRTFARDFIFPMIQAERDLRGPLPARHQHRPPLHHQGHDRRRPRRRCRRHRPRRHRQGQRPGPLRTFRRLARPARQVHRPVARCGVPQSSSPAAAK
jgi:hypothetical protein